MLTSRRIDRNHIQLNIAVDLGEAVDEPWLCMEKLVNLAATERDGLIGTELDLCEARDRARFSVGER
jgi:hypothetical protein